MKKLILAVLVVIGTGALSSFTIKNDTAARRELSTADARRELSTADARRELSTADARRELSTADAKHHANNDMKELSTAD
ncbi:MAG: hypothetical protein ABI166_16040 [Mucilaginibacter sp.]